MGDESVPFLLDQGTTKTYQIPIAHLDYKFIEKCTDVKHLEKILRVLRSGEEGCYPELTLFCEKRIEHLDPRSRALRKDKPPATASDFTAEEWETINGELMSWVTEMNEDDKKPQFPETLHERQDNLPPIRCSSSCLSANQSMEMMLDKKQIRAIFLFEFKMGHKAAETTRKINSVFGPGTANERTVQWWFKKFRKGDESLEDEERSGRPSEVDNDQLRAIIEADPLTTTREVAEELNVNHSTVVRHLKQIGKVKKLPKWVPHELTENQKNHRFEVSSSLILRNNNEPFLDRIVTCDEKWILYDNRRRPAQWLDREEPPKHFPEPNLHQKKVMVTVWWSAAGLIHHSFLNPSETITSEKYAQQIDEMHRNLQRLQPELVNRKGPILLHDNTRPHVAQPALQKLNELGYEVLPHPLYSPDLLPTYYHFFKHLDNFLQGKRFHNQQDAENAFQEFVESRSTDFYATGINKLTARWQKCVDCSGSYFD